MNAVGYRNVMQLTPETTNEDLRKLYSEWYQDYDKVSIRLPMHASEGEILRLYEIFEKQISLDRVYSYSLAPYLYHCEEKWLSTKRL